VTSFDVRGTNPQGTLNSLLALLDTALADKGVVKASPFVYPYFTNITMQAELRAAYNYKFVSGDPGALCPQLAVRGPASLRLGIRSGQHGGVSRQQGRFFQVTATGKEVSAHRRGHAKDNTEGAVRSSTTENRRDPCRKECWL
jgi:hypothetical protein